MVVQSTNTGSDLGTNHFDLLMPGGGVGIFDGCTSEFGTSLAGAQYGGISTQSQCDSYPAILQDGCNWRFDWFGNSDNPSLTFEQVQCPTEITDVSGCTRDDDGDYPVFSGAGSSSGSSSSSSAAAAASSAKASSAAAVQSKASSSSSIQAAEETKTSAQKSETVVTEKTTTTAQAASQAAEKPGTSAETKAPVAEKPEASSSQKSKTKTKAGCSAKNYTATLGASATAVSAASASTSTVAIYHQCDGAADQFPNGALACAEGSTCVYSNDFYSQCQPN